MEKKIEGVCRAALKAFGEEHQQRKAVEEMGELNAALMQYKDGRVTKEAVITEIADVLITVSQLGLIFGLDEVSREVDRKIDRLADSIEKWKRIKVNSVSIKDGIIKVNYTEREYYGG